MSGLLTGKAETLNGSDKPIVWTIAGSDSGGGAGIQADLATMQNLECHACSVITTVTAQNSVQVTMVESVSEAMLIAQLTALAEDMPPKAIKVGLIANQTQLNTLASWLSDYLSQSAFNDIAVIVDPVMVASCGDKLNQQQLDFNAFKGVVTLLTPNQFELQQLYLYVVEQLQHKGNKLQATTQKAQAPKTDNVQILNCFDDMLLMAQQVAKYFNCHVLAKGGDADWQGDTANDIYVCQHVNGGSVEHNHSVFLLSSARIDTTNNHGSGCTLSSAIASFLSHDYVLHDAIVLAKAYVTAGLINSTKVGGGAGYLGRTGWPSQLELMPTIMQVSKSLENDIGTQVANLHFKKLTTPLQVYPVVESVSMLASLLKAGCKTIQLRVKQDSQCDEHGFAFTDELQKQQWIESSIVNAIALGRDYKAQLFINDHWQLAVKHQAFGVHLGQEDAMVADLQAMSDNHMALGLSSHSYFEILLAAQCRPSYIALGHIFPTTTKQMPSKPQGLAKLARYVSLLKGHYPTVAIGGIDADVMTDVANTHVDDIAVVRAITHAKDTGEAFRRLNKQWADLALDSKVVS